MIIKIDDIMNAQSATRNPPPMGYNSDIPDFNAAFLHENPFGEKGPFNTKIMHYNMKIMVPVSEAR